jgi:uncharacterized protein with PIN domain
MAIPCPRCGRQYDATLFEFGRTVACDCGARLDRDAPRCSGRGEPEPRFACDAMLGKLARWLRVIGCDVVYRAHIDDAELAELALAEGRVILTRDRRLPLERKATRCLIVESESTAEQLRQVAATFELEWHARAFTRCTRCNGPIREAPKREVAGSVPTRVLLEQDRFARCVDCQQIYWRGSHVERMRRTLRRVLRESDG